MNIKNLNINNSTVTLAENITTIKGNSWGINGDELIQLVQTIHTNEIELKEFVKNNFDNVDDKTVSSEQTKKFIDILKKFGVDFAGKLTSTGIVELIKQLLI